MYVANATAIAVVASSPPSPPLKRYTRRERDWSRSKQRDASQHVTNPKGMVDAEAGHLVESGATLVGLGAGRRHGGQLDGRSAPDAG